MRRDSRQSRRKTGCGLPSAAPSKAAPGGRLGDSRSRRATILLMVVGLLSMLFVIVTAYLTLSRVDRLTINNIKHADTADQIVASMNNLALTAIRAQWENDRGEVLAGGGAYADNLGPGGAAFQSSLEPVPDPTAANLLQPGAYRYAQVTSLDPSRPLSGAQNYDDLMELDYATRFGVPGGATPYVNKLRNLSRDSAVDASAIDEVSGVADGRWLDADGDGIPDGRQAGMALAIEVANAIAGIPVRVPTDDNPNALLQMYTSWDTNFTPLTVQERDAVRSLAKRYEKNSRYDVATRIVSNGGKIALYAPENGGVAAPWNREWVVSMFNYVRHPADTTPLNMSLQADVDLLNEIAANASAIDPLLGRRGGMLATWLAPNANEDERTVIEVLRRLEGQFPRTMASRFTDVVNSPLKLDKSQRFNMATIRGVPGAPPPPAGTGPNEWEAYRMGIALSAENFNNEATGGAGVNTFARHDRRHYLAALSNSDDLARKQVVQDPASPAERLGIEEGQLKFVLADIVRPSADGGAFDSSGEYNTTTGPLLIRRLANYYYDLLDGYEGWRNGAGTTTEALSQREQAMSLAVNTVAAAAPFNTTTGRVDVVSYTDTNPVSGVATSYAGYGPQPFFTQAIASYDAGDSPEDLALGLEIYNPNDDDSGALNVPGSFSLDLTQFGVSLNDQFPIADPTAIRWIGDSGFLLLPGRERLAGRSFAKFSIHRPANTQHTNDLHGNYLGAVTDLVITPVPTGSGDQKITVKLWKRSLSGTPHLVDQIEIKYEDTQRFDTDGTEPEDEWWVSVRRDTRPESYWGAGSDPLNPIRGRWRMVMEIPEDDAAYNNFASWATGPDVDLNALGAEEPNAGPLMPTVPLILMNAPLVNSVVMGVPRPASFPTTGFLLFVPRFAHMSDGTTRKPMGRVLHEQFVAKTHNFNDLNSNNRLDEIPADFGHMPVFDNRQDVVSTSSFTNGRTGRLPWGLLVFDYFTTVDPRGIDGVVNTVDDIDPRQIPGRLNVNAAPWFLLSGLPILNPFNAFHINQNASPAFWSPGSGMLVGMDSRDLEGDTVRPRFIGSDSSGAPRTSGVDLPYFDGSIGMYRVGPYLAQSAAAYRDRLQYVEDSTTAGGTVYWEADKRNGVATNGTATAYPYRDNPTTTLLANRYGPVRGSTAGGTPKAGFLSLGELVNVAGFDSSSPAALDPGTVPPMPTSVDEGDFIKGVALLAMLDTHFLTTRSNTFTVYVTVTDRENPQASIRSQLTVDRSNLAPRVMLESEVGIDADRDGDLNEPLLLDTINNVTGQPGADTVLDTPAVLRDGGLPKILSERRIGYFNARYDE